MQTAGTSAENAPLLVPKAQVSDWLLLEELDKQRRYKEQLAVLEARYGMPFDAFEAHVISATEECFSEWDDYIDWQAARALHQAVLERIAAIRRGDFQVA